MARSSVTPTLLSPDSVLENLTGLVASANGTTSVTPGATGAGNGVTFPNFPGQTLFVVSNGATPTTLTVIIGSTLFGQSATSYSVGPTSATTINLVGPFHSALEASGSSNLIAIDFSSVTGVIVACLQLTGVY
jgi:hypothetical protein